MKRFSEEMFHGKRKLFIREKEREIIFHINVIIKKKKRKELKKIFFES